MNVGEYWIGGNGVDVDDDDYTEWLFLIVAFSTHNRKRCVLGLKCDHKTRRPFFSGEDSQAFWFYVSGEAVSCSVPFELSYRIRGSGKRFLTPSIV